MTDVVFQAITPTPFTAPTNKAVESSKRNKASLHKIKVSQANAKIELTCTLPKRVSRKKDE